MLSIHKLTYNLGGRTLYQDATLHVGKGDKIGLVAGNGAGKSTLLRIIMGQLTPDQGNTQKPKGYSIGWLHQELMEYSCKATVRSVVRSGKAHIQNLKKDLDIAAKLMEEDYSDERATHFVELQEMFQQQGGYEIEGKAERLMLGLGFKAEELDNPFNAFSGGWRMRALLAKLLLEEPDLLLLDEPTNHLDIESIQWVEEYLRSYTKEFIVISHDRSLLNALPNRIVAIEQNTLQSYPGNYDSYQRLYSERAEILESTYKNQQKEIQRAERFINRFRSKASKARLVQSRIKELGRMEMVTPLKSDETKARFSFTIDQPSAKLPLVLKEVSKSYGDKLVILDATQQVESGDRIGLIGANGKGKSTLLRLIAGKEKPTEGSLDHHANNKLTYYAQHQLEGLDLTKTPLEELQAHAQGQNETQLRTLLGSFRLTGDMVNQVMITLSGGEKACVALAKIALQNPNFLLLDEPTNHLDLEATEVLMRALSQYQGTCILVSHNRYFLQHIATKIWYIEDGILCAYPGNYDEYLFWQSQRNKSK